LFFQKRLTEDLIAFNHQDNQIVTAELITKLIVGEQDFVLGMQKTFVRHVDGKLRQLAEGAQS